jgi:predicted ribosomally synthesized peptide with SipW-like signal peptide
MLKKNKNKMTASLKKIILTLLIAGMNANGLAAVFGTYAYFSDSQVSTDNAFNAATLDFAAQHSWSFHPYSTCDPKEEICPGWGLTDTVNLTTAGTLDFQYTISIVNAAETASSTMPLCDYLTVNGVPLETFAFAPVLYSANPAVALAFSLTNNNGLLQDQTCNFDYLIQGWQTDGVAGYGQGFFVEKIIGSSITSDPWMVEVPAVESETGGEGEAEGEGGGSEGASEPEGGDIDDAADGDGQIQEQGEENQESEGDAGAEDGGEGDSAGNDDSGGNADGGDQNAGTEGAGQAEGEATGESAGGGEQQGSTAGGVDMGQAAAGGDESTGGGDSGNAGGGGEGTAE